MQEIATSTDRIMPLGHKVLVRQVTQKRSPTALILPDETEAERRYEVVEVGPGHRLDNGDWRNVCLDEGDIVVLEKYAGQEVILNGELHYLVNEVNIIAVIK